MEELYTKILVDTQYDLRAGVIFYASEIYTGEFKISLNGDQNQIIPLLGTFKRVKKNYIFFCFRKCVDSQFLKYLGLLSYYRETEDNIVSAGSSENT